MKLLNFNEEQNTVYYHSAIQNISFVDTSLNKNERINKCMELFSLQEKLHKENNLSYFLYHKYFPIEFTLENYRQEYFNDYPSRLSCIYTFYSREITCSINKTYNWTTPIKKVLLHPNCKVIKCDMNWITYFRKGNAMTKEVCLAYWNGTPLKEIFPEIDCTPVYEYLIEGKVEII